MLNYNDSFFWKSGIFSLQRKAHILLVSSEFAESFCAKCSVTVKQLLQPFPSINTEGIFLAFLLICLNLSLNLVNSAY